MMKFSRFWLPGKQLASKFLPEKNSNIKETSWYSNYSSRLGISTARSDSIKHGNYSGKTYADFSIFKGKAALSVSPVLPTFSRLDSGNSKVDRRGVVMLKFMPAIGQRKYDPEKKQLFALSATEIGCLISLGPAESCEFFHDPSMKSSLEGQVKKTLSVSPLINGEGYFFNLIHLAIYHGLGPGHQTTVEEHGSGAANTERPGFRMGKMMMTLFNTLTIAHGSEHHDANVDLLENMGW